MRPSTKEQVESLGAKFVEVPMTDEEKKANDGSTPRKCPTTTNGVRANWSTNTPRLPTSSITTALIPGRPAPVLVAGNRGRHETGLGDCRSGGGIGR